jgi:hypothetical protein
MLTPINDSLLPESDIFPLIVNFSWAKDNEVIKQNKTSNALR